MFKQLITLGYTLLRLQLLMLGGAAVGAVVIGGWQSVGPVVFGGLAWLIPTGFLVYRLNCQNRRGQFGALAKELIFQLGLKFGASLLLVAWALWVYQDARLGVLGGFGMVGLAALVLPVRLFFKARKQIG